MSNPNKAERMQVLEATISEVVEECFVAGADWPEILIVLARVVQRYAKALEDEEVRPY